MNCRYCGSSLRVGALFCGECGRSVNGERSLRGPSEPVGATEEVTPIPVEDSGLPSPLERSTSLLRCPQCSAVALSTDVFCRECGFVVGAAEVPSARDTVAVEGDLVPPTSDSSEAAAGLDAVPAPWPEQREEPKADGDAEPVDDSVPVPDTASESDVEPDSEPDAEPDIDPERDASPEAERDAEVDESSSAAAGLDLAPRRDPAAAGTGERFVLQFSTGRTPAVARAPANQCSVPNTCGAAIGVRARSANASAAAKKLGAPTRTRTFFLHPYQNVHTAPPAAHRKGLQFPF